MSEVMINVRKNNNRFKVVLLIYQSLLIGLKCIVQYKSVDVEDGSAQISIGVQTVEGVGGVDHVLKGATLCRLQSDTIFQLAFEFPSSLRNFRVQPSAASLKKSLRNPVRKLLKIP